MTVPAGREPVDQELVGRVRRKLGADLIETRRGFGYTVGDAAS